MRETKELERTKRSCKIICVLDWANVVRLLGAVACLPRFVLVMFSVPDLVDNCYKFILARIPQPCPTYSYYPS
jgi:hypothetical protein